MYKLMFIPLLALIGTACGGVPDSAVVADLSDDDLLSLCEEYGDSARSVTCSMDGMEFTMDIGYDSEEECGEDIEAPPAGCTATVGDYRQCQDAFAAMSDDEICGMAGLPAECAAMMACIEG